MPKINIGGFIKRAALLVSLLFAGSARLFAATCQSNASGGWATPGTWAGAGCVNTVPRSTDTVTIMSGHQVTLNVSSTVRTLTINAGGRLSADASNRTLTINPLTNQTAFTVNNSTAFVPNNSTVVINSTSSINVNVGSITFNNLSFTPTSVLAHTYTMGSGSVTCLGGFLINPTKASAGAIVTQVNMGAAMNVVGVTTVTATTNARSTFTTTSNNYDFTTGRLNVAANGTMLANGSQITINSTAGTQFTLGGTWNANTSTVTFSGDASLTLTSNAAIAFNHLNLAPSITTDRTYTFGTTAMTLTGDLTVTPNKSTAGTARLTVNMGAGITGLTTSNVYVKATGNAVSTLDTVSNFALTAGRIDMEPAGTFNARFSTITLSGTSGTILERTGTFIPGGSNVTINSNASVALTNSSMTFNILNLTPTITAGRAYTFGSSVTVLGNMTINPTAGSALTLEVDLGGDLVVASTRTLTITRTTSALTTLDTTGANYSITAGLLNIVTGAQLYGNDSTITLNGTSGTLFTATGWFQRGTSEVIMNPDAAITMTASGVTFYDLTLSPTLTTGRAWSTGTSSLTVQNNLTINPSGSGALTVTMGALAGVGGDVTLTGSGSATTTLNTGTNYALTMASMFVDSSETFTANASALTFTGTSGTLFSVLGTFNPGTSTLTYNGDGDATLMSGTFTVSGLTLNPTLTADREYIIGGSSLTLNGNFMINPIKTSVGNATLTVAMSSNIAVGAGFVTTATGTINAYSVLDVGSGVDNTLTTGRMDIRANGTFNARNSTITLTGTASTLWTRTGTFNEGGSHVRVTPDAAVTIFSGTQNFYNLSFVPTLSTGRTYTLGTSATLNLTGDLTVNPSGTGLLTMNMGAAISLPSDRTILITRTGGATATLDATTSNHAITAGYVDIETGGTLNGRSSQIIVNGNSGTLWTQTGTFTTTASTVTFNPDANVTLTNGTLTFNHLQIAPTLTADRIYQMSSGDLTINGSFTIVPDKPDAGNATLTVNMGAAINVAAANATLISGTNNAFSILDTVDGSNYTLSTGRLDIKPNGTLLGRAAAINLTGTFGPMWAQTGVFVPGFSIVSATANATVNPITSGGVTFYDLTFSPQISGNRVYTMGSSSITVLNNFTLNPTGSANSLTVNFGAPIEVGGMTTIQRTGSPTSVLTTTVSNHRFNTGQLNVATGGTFTANGSSITLTGTTSPLITRAGTYTAGTSTVTVVSQGSQTLLSGTITLIHLIIDTPGYTQTLGAATTISGNLIINNGRFDDGGSQITGNATNRLVMAAGTEMYLGVGATATTFPTLFTNTRIFMDAVSTVTYNSGQAQTISGTPTYANLALVAPSNSPTKTLGAATVVSGNVLIGANNTLDVSGTNYLLSIGGNYRNEGSFNARTGTVTMTGTAVGQTLSGDMLGANDFSNLTFNGAGDWSFTDPVLITSSLTVLAGTLTGNQDITVNGGVIGNGTSGIINLTGGNFEQRVAANQRFGSYAGASNWVFNNLTFSNSGATGRTILVYGGGTGRIETLGTLSVGSADPGVTTLDNNTNDRLFDVDGGVYISSQGVFQSASAASLNVGGDWNNRGVFMHNASSVTFNGTGTQYVRNMGNAFGIVVSSNASAGGLVLASSMTMAQLFINTSNLSSAATIYFAGRSTFTISTFTVLGAASLPVVMKSTDSDIYWHLNNTSTHTVRYAYAQDSNASSGRRILVNPGGGNLGHTLNWAFGVDTPTGFQLTGSQNSSLDYSWNDNVPEPDWYTLQISSNSGFTAPASSSQTTLTAGTTATLSVNTTYYARLSASIDTLTSNWASTITTATLANVPATVASTWTFVRFSSATAAWALNGNPASVTQYVLQLSTVGTFDSGTIFSSATKNLSATITGLNPGDTYFGQVKAINHSNISTAWFALGSTVTMAPGIPSNFRYTASISTALTTTWDVPVPAGETYTYVISTDSNFDGTLFSSSTANLFATNISPLTPNTTYHGRVNSVNAGIQGTWASAITTATLANVPLTAASTWSAVNFSSFTVTWNANSNPTGITLYRVDIATASDYSSEEFFSSNTYNTNVTFDSLQAATTYYARVRAVNHSGIATAFIILGSTKTLTPNTCNATTSGNWDTGATWTNCTGGGGLPSITDVITINQGITVVQNVTATVGGIIFAAPGTNNTLTQLSTVTLTVNGPVTFNQPTVDSRSSGWNINAGTVTVSGLITFAGSNVTTTRVSSISITSGQLNALNGMTFVGSDSATKVINMSGGAGSLNLKGNLTIPANSATLTAGTAGSIFNYNDDASAQTVRFFTAGAYNNLHINNTSGLGATLSAAVSATNVTGNLRVQSGILKNGGFAIVGGAGDTFEVSNNATFEMSGTSAFPTSFTTFTFGATSRTRYLQTSTPLTLTAQTYGHLDLMPAGAATQNFPAGAFSVVGDLSMGDGTNAATVSANTNSTTLTVGGTVLISTGSSFAAHATNPFIVNGSWTNFGTFTHNSSTVAFTGTSVQTVDNKGKSFGNLISSNTSASGIVFSSSFSAARLMINTTALGSASTAYFAAGSTFTISSFTVIGSAAYPITLLSTIPGVPWYLNNTSTHSITYARVMDSVAIGLRMLDSPGGFDLGGNTRWAFAVNAPTNNQYTLVGSTTVSVSWDDASPSADSYTLEIATASNFSGAVLSSSTLNLFASNPTPLTTNTTYHARVKSIIGGTSSSWTSTLTTATLANIPATLASTWTAVNRSSITMAWGENSNPTNTTLYVAEISDIDDFSSIVDSSSTYNANATFFSLIPASTYFGRVKAINHSGIETDYLLLGSTDTKSPTACNATATGNWSTGGIWTGCTGPGGIPSDSDAITINAGVTVTQNVTSTVAAINFTGGATTNRIMMLSTVTLTVSGDVTFNQTTTNGISNGLWVNHATATVQGAIIFAGASTNNRRSTVTVNSGMLMVSTMTFAGTTAANKNVIISGVNGRIDLLEGMTGTASATLTTTAGSVFNYAGSVAQSVVFFGAGGYNNLYFNNSSGSGATLSAAVSATNVAGSLRVQSGTFKNGGFAIVGGAGDTFEVSNGATFEMSGTSAFPATFTTFTFGPTSRVRYLQTSTPVTLASQTFGHLDLMPAGTATHNFPAGAFSVAGDLSIGNGTNATTVSANANNTTLTVGGAININANGTFTAHASNPLLVSGDWNNNGIFTHNSSSVSFNGLTVQAVDNKGNAFGTVISSNIGSSGIVFSSSFSAARLYINTNGLGSAATAYFTAGATYTITNLSINGTSSFPITLRSTIPGVPWHLNNTSTHSVSYVRAMDSDASLGLRILDYPIGEDLSGNTNWAIGLNPPSSIAFNDANNQYVNLQWTAATPTPDSYTVQFSTNSSFVAPVTSDQTGSLSISSAALTLNTTYYGRAISSINGAASAWSATAATATWAATPTSAASTWSAVNFTSATAVWLANGNPTAITRYVLEFSTVSDFASGQTLSSTTFNLSAAVISLTPESTYYARVKAVNHSGIDTAYLNLSSTITYAVNPPTGFFFSSAAATSLVGRWTAPAPVGNSYDMQVSTASDFSGTITSSNTALLIATTAASLSVNTTYYGRVNAIISGSSSAWVTTITTATLANAPLTVASTWTAVNITSITFTWNTNGNPATRTQYDTEFSTVSGFNAGTVFSSTTYNNNVMYDQLDSGTTYYARVRAVNHSGIITDWLTLGSTHTIVSAIPKNLRITETSVNSVTAAWDASVPPGQTYTLRVSTDSDFGGTITSSTTANLFATPLGSLLANTTYFAQANATIASVTYPWSAFITTATLANAPATVASTWTAINITSLTVTWSNNSNPLPATQYQVQLSTVGNFDSGTIFSSSTYNVNADFTSLLPFTTYYSRVRAINHYNIPTSFLTLGSTMTRIPQAPLDFAFTAASTNTLRADWSVPNPPGTTYLFQVSTASNFSGTVTSSTTANLYSTTTATLSVNTTYYGRVETLLSGTTSVWTTSITTSTLARAPATAASTWTAVFLTSMTVNWTQNGNPTTVTQYTVELSTDSGFNGDLVTLSTYALTTTFESLETATTYYGRVKAINHSGIDTDYFLLGSTVTRAPNTCNATTSGNWHTPGIWSNCTGPGGIPGATDIVNINSGVSVDLTVDATVGGLVFATATANNALTHSTNSLTINGDVYLSQPSVSSRNNSWNINDGTATVAGLIVFRGTNTTTSRVSRIVITSGELNAFGGMTFDTSASATKLINMSGGAGRINLKGAITIPANSATLTAGTAGSVFNYADSVAQTVRFFTAGAYNHLYLNNTALTGAILGAGVTAANVTGDVRVQSGMLRNGGFAITGNTGQTFAVDNAATFEMSGTSAFPASFTTYSFGTTSRVRYLQTSSPLTITSETYGHLDLSPAGAATQNFASGLYTIQGDLTIGGNATVVAQTGNSLEVGGNWTNSGAFTANTGTVTFTNSSSHTLTGASTFYALRAVTSNTTLYFTAGATQYINQSTEFRNVHLRSSSNGSRWHFNYSGSSLTLVGVTVQDSDASGGGLMQTYPPSVDAGNNVNWDFGAPSAIDTFTATQSTRGASINLSWTAPGEDSSTGTLYNSTFTIQYTTDTVFASGVSWSPNAAMPSHVYRVVIATTNVNPGDVQGATISGLISGGTYYFRIWTTDTNSNYSALSVGATNWATVSTYDLTLSTDTIQFGSLATGTTNVINSSITVTNTGNIICNFQLGVVNPAIWTATSTSTGIDTFRLMGLFKDTLPVSADFSASNDFILTSSATATATIFARDADAASEKGINVEPGQSRALWLRIEMPAISSTTDDQVIRLRAYSSQ